ncbi:MAG TPA: hypothetical protein VF484_03440 [Candidatus Limnocylindrales bacterium]
MTLEERAYRTLLRLYPRRYRLAYADAMTQLFRDQLRDARTGGARRGVARTWLSTFADVGRSAAREHLAGPGVGQSLDRFESTVPMRLAGALAIGGAVLLEMAFATFEPFGDRHVNAIRLLLFWSAGLVIALAFHRRQAVAQPRLALAATATVVVFGAWNIAWLLLAWDRDSPFAGDFGFLGFMASFLGWLAAAFFGGSMLAMRAAWRGMSRSAALATRVGAALLLAGPVATVGMDRLGLTGSEPYGALFGGLGAVGVGVVGLGWLMLGGVLCFAGRSSAVPAGADQTGLNASNG